ncbi:MAG: TerB N-terminal domain-containing protein [Acidimicrobiia bacterium]
MSALWRWVPAGESVQVGPSLVSAGLFYLGRNLGAVSAWRGTEPAMIDPSLPIDRTRPEWVGAGANAWSSYTRLSPARRATYVSWLAGGRCDPSVPIGCVLLFFAGLERRALYDARSDRKAFDELSVIESEVRRLVLLYGSHLTWRKYVTNFVAALDVVASRDGRDVGHARAAGASEGSLASPPGVDRHGWPVALALKLGLSRLACAARPVPAEWALAWARAHPEISLQVPEPNCQAEFAQLFTLRYRERFGGGLVLNSTILLKLTYGPASEGFGGPIELPAPGLFDVSGLKEPVEELAAITSSVAKSLAPYSLWLDRHPGTRGTPAATALLPSELVATDSVEAVTVLRDWIEGQLGDRPMADIDGAELGRHWPPAAGGMLTRADAAGLALLVEALGYGIEPDVRFGGPIVGRGPVVLFRLGRPVRAAGGISATASAVLRLAAGVVAATDAAGCHTAAERIQEELGFPAAERPRVAAHLRWCGVAGRGLDAASDRLRELSAEQRATIGSFLVRIAVHWGAALGPAQLAELTKAFGLLDLEPAAVGPLVEARIREAAREAAIERANAAPGTARRERPATARYTPELPARYEPFRPPPSPAGPFIPDAGLVRAKLQETETVAALLGEIFAAEDEPAVPVPPAAGDRVAGLDAAHTRLLRLLSAHARWTRAGFRAAAASVGLLPDGALDVLNESALETCGDVVCEGEDPIDMNLTVLQELGL